MLFSIRTLISGTLIVHVARAAVFALGVGPSPAYAEQYLDPPIGWWACKVFPVYDPASRHNFDIYELHVVPGLENNVILEEGMKTSKSSGTANYMSKNDVWWFYTGPEGGSFVHGYGHLYKEGKKWFFDLVNNERHSTDKHRPCTLFKRIEITK
jgi:hypothetical protein